MNRLLVLVSLAAIVSGGCAYHMPDAPTPIDVTPSTAAASIRLAFGSRSDRSMDVSATVLTSSGAYVAGARVELATSSGTLSSTSGVTDSAGMVRSILTNNATATLRATAAGIVNEISVPGVPDVSIPSSTPPTPTPGPAPGALTVTINASPTGVAGSPVAFGASTQASAGAFWTFGDGGTASSLGGASHVFTTTGVFVVGVTVTDTLGRTASAQTSITIAAAPLPPGTTPTTPALTLALTCTPATHGLQTVCNYGATDETGANVTTATGPAEWDFGDGSPHNTTFTALAQHIYSQAGKYVIAVSTVGVGGRIGRAQTSVTIP